MISLAALAIVVESFLLGSIPWGVVISHLVKHDDVRTHGSGNIGTTNMIRAYGKKLGYICFVLDFAKAALACALVYPICDFALATGSVDPVFVESRILLITAGMFAILGHIFSPWLGFKGGKGVACGGGVSLVAFGWPQFLILLAVFIVFVVATKAVSAGSIAAAAVFPFLGVWVYWGNTVGILMSIAIGAVVIWSHRSNIERLAHGTENKIGSKKTADK
ncbi:MAG: glycerol-3-phosphate 1-O-acyltransferase PlsY [Eggerthellales bacterium]|nr:glycerol-3-phosphate 1-O-acyltransferase PlsY [Eggerthellales bacterium]